MKIYNLSVGSNIYTSNVYLITGTWNAMKDVNTLIDVGRDSSIIDKINNTPTGVGKHKVDQIILTHGHYDHAEILKEIKKMYNAKVYAYSSSIEGVDEKLVDGQSLTIGDKLCEIIYAPCHSSDSICILCKEDGVLFAGDNPIIINSNDAVYGKEYIKVIERLSGMNINKICPGHGTVIEKNCNEAIKISLNNLKIDFN